MTASKAISEPLELVLLRVIKLSTFESVSDESSVFLMTSSKAMVMSELTAIPVAESAGVKSRLGAVESAAIKVIELAVIALSESSSTVAPMATYTVCSLEKLLSGLIVMTFLAVSMVALKSISVPLESESFKVIKLSTLVFVNAESSVFLIASLKVNVILSVTGTGSSRSAGSKTIVGEIVSTTVKVIELALIALSEASSTVAPMAT